MDGPSHTGTHHAPRGISAVPAERGGRGWQRDLSHPAHPVGTTAMEEE